MYIDCSSYRQGGATAIETIFWNEGLQLTWGGKCGRASREGIGGMPTSETVLHNLPKGGNPSGSHGCGMNRAAWLRGNQQRLLHFRILKRRWS